MSLVEHLLSRIDESRLQKGAEFREPRVCPEADVIFKE
jgi:hypothetical protein